ncbi:MAG: hypothetical protein C0606_05060 [Hyphomicrobiales bacterium]|nr:MAG: hypothetical protein C0606_05060 [Hyphomicrobiales bacterium]
MSTKRFPDAPRAPKPVGPPLTTLFSDSRGRKAFLRYWLLDPLLGGIGLAMHFLFRLVLPKTASKFGAFGGRVVRKLIEDDDIEAYFKRVFLRIDPELDHDPARLAAISTEWWQSVGRTYADYSHVDRLYDRGLVAVEGREHLEAARASGRPLIFVSVHLGNFELLGDLLLVGKLGVHGLGIYQPQPNRFENKVLDIVRRRYDGVCLPPGQASAVYLMRHIHDGENALIFIDDVADNQIHLPLFGRPVPTRSNAVKAVKLALSVDGLLVPVHNLRENDGRFRVTFGTAIEPLDGASRSERIERTIRWFSDYFEPLVRAHPEQWFMAHSVRFRAGDRECEISARAGASHSAPV